VFDADNAHSLALPANRVDGRHKRVKTMEIMTIRHSGVNTVLALLAAACLACAASGRAAEAVPQAGGDDAEARMIVEKADQVRFPGGRLSGRRERSPPPAADPAPRFANTVSSPRATPTAS
jgi:hypothetical protein